MATYEINGDLFKAMFTESVDDFVDKFSVYCINNNINDFTFWKITGNICEPYKCLSEKNGTFDIFEFGYSDSQIAMPNKEVSYFDVAFFITCSVFFSYKKRPILAVTFHSDVPQDIYNELEKYAPYLGKYVFDLTSVEKRMDLYVDYQKKVDFVKRAGVIFKALDIEDVISVSLTFFMEVFSAEAVFAIHKGAFKGIGLDETDLSSGIYMGELSLKNYMASNKKTEFLENVALSEKFNIKNVFFVYEETSDILFGLFNILTDIIPDKEFSSLVAGIVSIAVENAENHEKMTSFKVEETEISNTVNILNKFVQREITPASIFDICAVTYPARNAGGDFIDIRTLNGKIVLCLADVCGKGYSAAVFTVVLSVFMENLDKFSSLAAALKSLNKFFLDKNFENRFITLFACVIDEKTRSMDYISCGHDPAFIIDGDNTSILRSKYLPIGLAEENYETTGASIPKDSLFFIYTDGLIEYTDFDGLVKIVRGNSGKNSSEITASLYDSLVPDRLLQKDDFTCIVLKDKKI